MQVGIDQIVKRPANEFGIDELKGLRGMRCITTVNQPARLTIIEQDIVGR
jgi:hypothetical protein